MKVLLGLKMNITPLKQNTAASSAYLSSALFMIILWEVWQFFRRIPVENAPFIFGVGNVLL